MRLKIRPVPLAFLLFGLIVLPLGILEGWYGRVDYSGDAIPYLDMAQAVHAGDWKLVFNPLWGLGYALLIAAAKPFFAATPEGEWNAVHLLNLLIYMADYASFIFLLRSVGRSLSLSVQQVASNFAQCGVILAGTALFLSTELCLDTVSRVGPDTLVTTLILLALGLVLRLRDLPRHKTALTLGVVLGLGYIVKTIILPFSLIILVVVGLGIYRRNSPKSILPSTLVFLVLFALPYVAGLSWAFGRFTMGESGTLNYAWHVNRLELMHWQGGPAQFGKPLHPTKRLLMDPPIYGFSTPFNVSYPPFFNPPYYYEGYRHFFSAELQLRAIFANLLHLFQALIPLPITYAVLLCLLLVFRTGARGGFISIRREWMLDLISLWPILIPALGGIALYLQVHLEGRYLPAFLLVLASAPISVFLLRLEGWPRYVSKLVLALLIAGCVVTLLKVDRSTIRAAAHRTRYSGSSQWVLARYLQQHGLAPGDEVAVIAGPSNHCTWAHVDHLRIVAELEPDIYAPSGTGEHMFWDASPQAQQQMLDVFARAGAKEVIARVVQPKDLETPGWTAVPGTDDMVHPLQQP